VQEFNNAPILAADENCFGTLGVISGYGNNSRRMPLPVLAEKQQPEAKIGPNLFFNKSTEVIGDYFKMENSGNGKSAVVETGF
jgi:hypothetical protein